MVISDGRSGISRGGSMKISQVFEWDILERRRSAIVKIQNCKNKPSRFFDCSRRRNLPGRENCLGIFWTEKYFLKTWSCSVFITRLEHFVFLLFQLFKPSEQQLKNGLRFLNRGLLSECFENCGGSKIILFSLFESLT